MATPEKEAAIAELKENLQNCTVAIMSKYEGITADEVSSLRSQLRDQNVTYRVYKNTLAKRALDELDLGAASQYMDGPTAWAFCDDPVAPAKLLKDFGKKVKEVSMVGGVLEGVVIPAEKLTALADLPSREQLLAQVVGTIAAPLRNLVGTLDAVPRKMVNVVDAIRRKKEGDAA